MKKRRFDGDIALLYAIWYGAGRFWIEGLRTDSLLLVPSMGLRASQLVAGFAVVAGIAAEIVLSRRSAGKALMVPLAVSADNRKLQAQVAKKEGVPQDSIALPAEEAYAELPRAEFLARTAAYNAELSSCNPPAFLVYYLSRLAWAPEMVRGAGPALTASEYTEKEETYVRNHRYRR